MGRALRESVEAMVGRPLAGPVLRLILEAARAELSEAQDAIDEAGVPYADLACALRICRERVRVEASRCGVSLSDPAET